MMRSLNMLSEKEEVKSEKINLSRTDRTHCTADVGLKCDGEIELIPFNGIKQSKKKYTSWVFSVFVISLFTILISCGESFQPIQENDAYTFSIYGYLDASADTNWVRVIPARQQLEMPPGKPEMYVTLEHVQSGNISVMNDSLIQLLFPAGVNILSHWTTMDLEPGQVYRLHAERPDEKDSNVSVTLPEVFPTPRLEISGATIDRLYISGVERLADVQSRWFFRISYNGQSQNRIIGIPYRNSAEKTGSGEYIIRINRTREGRRVAEQLILPEGAEARLLHRQIFVASGGPEWDEEILSLDDQVIALPDIMANVDGGVGYLAGIVSKSIPYESCYNNDNPFEYISCPEEKPFW